MGGGVVHLVEGALHAAVLHHRAGRLAEHVLQLPVDGLLAGAVVHEGELHVARGLAYLVHRGPLAVGDALQAVDVLAGNHQTHALL